MRSVKRRNGYRYEISMINLIDIIFVLLIFFMITTTFTKFTHFDIKLPESKNVLNKKNKDTLEIIYLKNKQFIVKNKDSKKQYSFESLLLYIKNLSNIDKNSIKLSADKNISYGEIITLISSLKGANVENIQLNIERKM